MNSVTVGAQRCVQHSFKIWNICIWFMHMPEDKNTFHKEPVSFYCSFGSLPGIWCATGLPYKPLFQTFQVVFHLRYRSFHFPDQTLTCCMCAPAMLKRYIKLMTYSCPYIIFYDCTLQRFVYLCQQIFHRNYNSHTVEGSGWTNERFALYAVWMEESNGAN